MTPQNPNLLVQQIFEIFLGDAKFLPLKAMFQGTFAPLSLENAQEIEVQVPLAAGGVESLFLSDGDVEIVGATNLGTFGANIASALSPLLQQGTLQDVFAVITLSSGTNINVTTGLNDGEIYVITSVGNTDQSQWEALGVTVGVDVYVGLVFTAKTATPGSGTGVVQTLAQNSPFTVPFRKCFSVFER